jgi:glyoxylase I family protein
MRLPTANSADGAYATLRECGIAAKEPKIVYYGMKQVYVTDPDGYTLCFQWPIA